MDRAVLLVIMCYFTATSSDQPVDLVQAHEAATKLLILMKPNVTELATVGSPVDHTMESLDWMDEVACPHAVFISRDFLMHNSNAHTSNKTTSIGNRIRGYGKLQRWAAASSSLITRLARTANLQRLSEGTDQR